MVDRYGPKRMWALSATGQAGLFAVWPFIGDFAGYVASDGGRRLLGGAAHGAPLSPAGDGFGPPTAQR